MSGQLQSGIKYAAILAISLFVTWLLYAIGTISSWDRALYDRCINYRVSYGSEKRNAVLATIDLNDESIDALGEELDTRRAFADVLEVINDTNAMAVLDFVFTHEKRDDPSFIKALELIGKTVMATVAVDAEKMKPPYRELTDTERRLLAKHTWHIKVLEKGKVPEAGTFLLPYPAVLSAAGQIAHINMDPDTDGIYRRVPLLYEWDGGYIPSLGLAAAVSHLRILIEDIELKAGAYLALKRSEKDIIRIPIDEQGRMLVPYTENFELDIKRKPFHIVTKAKYNDDVFEEVLEDLGGRIALVAEISTSQKDFGPTSFEALYPLSGVHAEVISGVLNGLNERTFIGWASLLFKVLTLILIICIAFVCFYIRKDLLFHLGFLAALVIFSGVTFFRWQNATLYPWFAFPAFLLFFLWGSAYLHRLFARYREQLLLHNALSRYFPHALAERIMRERKIDLKPAYKELTILFSDISGFTKWSSDKSPEDVHNFLSDYLESMAGILFAHGGTVDKFMGDGILSFFGDPFEMTNHTEQCIRAAIAMQEKVRTLAEKWKPIVDIDLKVRIGINTGKVIVGNLGNKTRIEYTVIGAAVNLAQRMESNAPVGGILVTADVREKVKDKFTFPERRDITVKGYAETIEAYVVKG